VAVFVWEHLGEMKAATIETPWALGYVRLQRSAPSMFFDLGDDYFPVEFRFRFHDINQVTIQVRDGGVINVTESWAGYVLFNWEDEVITPVECPMTAGCTLILEDSMTAQGSSYAPKAWWKR
jgi:hypothetical protein